MEVIHILLHGKAVVVVVSGAVAVEDTQELITMAAVEVQDMLRTLLQWEVNQITIKQQI
jgi:hypothetical protein